MSRGIVVLWLGTAASHPLHEPDLEGWAAARMVALEEPATQASFAEAGAEADVAARIEALLADARTASYGADPAAAESALQSAELLLRGNPSLPEAAWLMAETCRAHAALVREQDPDLSAVLERRALALEGTRARAFGEGGREEGKRQVGPARKAPGVTPAALPESSPGSSKGAMPLGGALPSDDVEIDGASVPEPRTVGGGEHHVRVLRRGRLAWAGWVDADLGPHTLPLPGIVPCSESDFEAVRLRGTRVDAGNAVLCPDWAVAHDAGEQRIEIAVCEHARCGTLLPWSRTWGKDFEGPAHPPWPRPSSNGWITWTALSVAAVAGGSLALWRTGAFDRQGPPHDTVTFSGPSAR